MGGGWKSSSLSGNRTTSSSGSSMPAYQGANGVGAASMGAVNHGVDRGSDDVGFLLDFGTSVTNSEEQRRNIQLEIKEIDAAIQNIEAGIHTERRASSHVAMQMTNSRKEMENVAREAAERLESAGVLKEQRLVTEQTVRNDLVLPLSDNTGSYNAGGEIPTRNCSLKKFLSLRRDDREKILSQLQDGALYEIKAKTASLKDELAAINKTIADEHLVEKLAQKKRELESLKKNLEEERKRHRTMQAAIQHAQAQGGDFAQEISNKERLLANTKMKNAADHAEFRKKVEAMAEEIRGLKNKQAMEADVAAAKNERDRWAVQVSEVQNLLQKREAVKLERGKVRAETVELKKAQETLAGDVETAQVKVAAAQKALEETLVKLTAAESLKDTNDLYEAETYVQAEAELDELNKAKEAVAKAMADISDGKEAELAKLAEAEKNDMKMIEKLDTELAEEKKNLDDKELELKQLNLEIDKAKTAIQKEIEQTQQAIDKVNGAIEAEHARLDGEKAERNRKDEEALDDAMTKRAAQARLLKILQHAAQKIEETKEEQAILQKPVDEPDVEGDYRPIVVKKPRLHTKSVLEKTGF